MDINDIEDKLTTTLRQRDKLVIELNNKTEEIMTLLENKYRLDPEMVQVNCIQCNGLGRVKGEDGKQILCPTCNGLGYLWMKKFIQQGD